jgi:hypothetical protein
MSLFLGSKSYLVLTRVAYSVPEDNELLAQKQYPKVWFCLDRIHPVCFGLFYVLWFPPVFFKRWFHTLLVTMLVLTQDYRGGGGGRGGGARCHTRVRGQPLPGGRRDGALVKYVTKLCSTLVVRQHGFSAKAWGPCVQLYLGCFLPPDAEPDEAKRACELFRTRTASQSESNRVRRLELEVE